MRLKTPPTPSKVVASGRLPAGWLLGISAQVEWLCQGMGDVHAGIKSALAVVVLVQAFAVSVDEGEDGIGLSVQATGDG